MPNMPQDGLRSAVYRSFLKCDDPKGVVEGRTIRKSKTSSKKLEGKIENPIMPKNLNTSSSYKEEGKERVSKNVTEDFHNPPSFQLIEVSRGAQKLNQVIDSWSNGMTVDGHPKEIAKDLLKGALDLQDSLIMLGKLQEASQYVAKLKKNQKEKSRGQRIDEIGIERMNSQMEFQKPKLSADGSSRDCFEELRTAIRDGLARQNLLPPGSTEKKAYCDKRTLNSALDIASTSSSQSSMANFHSSFDSSFSSKAQQKSKGSNLIAKLIGLEEIPSQAVETNPRKQLESDKISSPRRPMFDIDKPKARKPQSAAYKEDGEQKKLREIFETMQFKGLLKSNSAKEFRLQSHHSNVSDSKKRFTEDAPPIVIIKPSHFSKVDAEEPHWQNFIWDVGALDKHEVLRNLKTSELQAQTVESEGALNSSEMGRRLKGAEAPIERLGQEWTENCKEIQAKPEEIIVVKSTSGKLSSNKLKVSVPVNQQEKKKAIEKKVDRIQKATPNRRKAADIENVKSKAVSKSHDQATVTSAKERKPKTRSNITKAHFSQKKSPSSSPISKHTTLDKSHSYGDQKKNLKNEKPVKKPLAANSVVENVGSKNDDKLLESIDLTSTTSATNVDCLLPQEGTESDSVIQIKDQCDSSQNSPCNVTRETTQYESCIKSAEECIVHNATVRKCFRTKTNAEDLLLSSPSFLSYAEELFDINPNQAIVLQTRSLDISEKADTRLLLDCANELMQHKSLRCKQAIHPLVFNPARNSKFGVSLARLVEEVCSGIENLRSYSKQVGETLPVERTYAVLERDLRFKGIVNGAWDLGWRHGFSVDEVDQVVGDIEKLVFSGLIEEAFIDFVV